MRLVPGWEGRRSPYPPPHPAYHGPLRGANIGFHERRVRCAARTSAAPDPRVADVPSSPRPRAPGRGANYLALDRFPNSRSVARMKIGRYRHYKGKEYEVLRVV